MATALSRGAAWTRASSLAILAARNFAEDGGCLVSELWTALLAVPALPLGLAAYNLLTWARPRPGGERPRVSVAVLVPARNEERSLGAALESILRQPAVTEVLVCDDGSTDRTPDIVRSFAASDPRVRLVTGSPLPEGWVGKPFACHQLAREAKAEVLCFLDADVRVRDGAFEALVARLGGAEERRVVTVVPLQEMRTFAERLVLPLLLLTYLCWLPLTLVARGRDPRFVAACGQILCLRRKTYDEVGGFESIRGELVDDVAFCRRAKVLGVTVDFVDGSRLGVCRMYESFAQVWRGFSKNIFEGLGRSLPALAVACALHFFGFVFPFVALALRGFGVESIPFGPALAGVLGNLALRLTLVGTHRHPPLFALAHPFAVLTLLGIALNSARWTLRGNVEWAGRAYGARRVVG